MFVKTAAQNLALVIAAVVVSLGVGEILLWQFAPPTIQVKSGTYFTPKALLYGWAYPPGMKLASHNPDTGEVTAVFKTNSEGWKDVEHTRAKPKGAYRILVLGDSHTFGLPGIGRLYPRRLEDKLHSQGYDDIEVIIISGPAWTTIQYIVALENEGLGYDPDLVIYQFCDNDLGENIPRPVNWDWAKPITFELKNGVLVRKDRRAAFKELVAKKLKSQTTWDTMRDLLASTAIYQKAIRARAKFDKWAARKDGAKLAQVHDLMFPIQANRGTHDQRHLLDIEKANLVGYEKNYAKTRKQVRRLVDELKAGRSSEVLMSLHPAREPFSYRVGPWKKREVYSWNLMSALLKKMKTMIEKSGARFIVFSEDGEEGKRNFFRNAGNVEIVNGEEFAREVVLGQPQQKKIEGGKLFKLDWERTIRELRERATSLGIPVVPHKRIYHRYLTDYHPNAEGYQNMAFDIADFLETWLPFAEGYRNRQ